MPFHRLSSPALRFAAAGQAVAMTFLAAQALGGSTRFETVTLRSSGPVATLQLAFQPDATSRHPVILMLGSLKEGELPDWSTNLVREGFMLAAFSVAHPPDPDPARRPQWLFFDERFAHSYVLGGLRMADDTRRVIDYLVTRADVHPQKIGWMGSSTTGIFGLAAAVHEKRLSALVAFVATGAYERWLDTWKPHGLWRSGTNDLWPETRALLPQADPIRAVTNLYPCALLLVSGGEDKVVDPASARAFVEAARPFYRSDPDRLRLVIYEGQGHNLPRDIVSMYAEHWFRLYLHPSNAPPAPPVRPASLPESARQTAVNATPHERLIGVAEPIVPWKTNRPIAEVTRKLYKKHPRPGAAAIVGVRYVGPKLERMETHAVEFRDDVHNERFIRLSRDNGQTWSEPRPVPATDVYHAGKEVWEGEGADCFDPASGALVGVWLRQIRKDRLYHCFIYWRTSLDFGQTWSTPRQLRYEAGGEFDPAEPHNPDFLRVNQAYFGNNILRHSNGTLIHCVAHANAPRDPQNEKRPWKMGSLCFIGRWDAARREYVWEAGQRVEISPAWSARGLMEPEVAELGDGRVLIVWRGSTTGWDGTRASLPGRKFFSLSRDGGRTLSPPSEWKYAAGGSFYSPSSIHRMIRHSVTGKLYWVGNLCAEPPEGNAPRYPLVLAEVDEAQGALRAETVTVIDDRRPGQPAAIQLSNFSLLENRETHELELFLTLYGEDPASVYSADCYRYAVRLKP